MEQSNLEILNTNVKPDTYDETFVYNFCMQLLCVSYTTVQTMKRLCVSYTTVQTMKRLCVSYATAQTMKLLCVSYATVQAMKLLCVSYATVQTMKLLCVSYATVQTMKLLCVSYTTVQTMKLLCATSHYLLLFPAKSMHIGRRNCCPIVSDCHCTCYATSKWTANNTKLLDIFHIAIALLTFLVVFDRQLPSIYYRWEIIVGHIVPS